jgi:hypothetical protein
MSLSEEQFFALYDEVPRTAEGGVLYRTRQGETRSLPISVLYARSVETRLRRRDPETERRLNWLTLVGWLLEKEERGDVDRT